MTNNQGATYTKPLLENYVGPRIPNTNRYLASFQTCARLRKESRRCLSHSKKLTADRTDVVKGLKEQLDALHVSARNEFLPACFHFKF